MADKYFKALDNLTPAEVLRVDLTPEGIERLQHLLFLIEHAHLHARPSEIERIKRIIQAGDWPPDHSSVIEVTVTDTFVRAAFERAVQGFLKKPVKRCKPHEESSSNLPRTDHRARHRPRVTEPVDLKKVCAVLELGLKQRELAEAVGVGEKSVDRWSMARRANLEQMFSETEGLTEALDALHNTVTKLSQHGLDKRSITA